jgi:hypothetical protein
MNTRDLLVLTLYPSDLKEGWRAFSEVTLDDFRPRSDIKRARTVKYRGPDGKIQVLKDLSRKRLTV